MQSTLANKNKLKSFLAKYKSIFGLIILCIIASLVSPRFLTTSNMMNVLTQVSVNAVLAIGMTFVILSGGIDLSVGSILAISGAVAATIIGSTGSVLLSVIVAIVIGGLIGLFNGLVVAKGRIQAFIVTLASMTIFRGVTYVFTNGTPISRLGDAFGALGNKRILGNNLPLPVIFTVIVLILAYYILSETRYGRYLYALGGNEDSARLSGIDTNKIKTLVYVVSGAAAALSGIIVTSRIGSASPNAGMGFELDAIAAVVIGGTSLSGGEGSVIGTMVGALIIGVLNNSLNLMNVSPFYQAIIKGIVILAAVLIDKRERK
ncbi:ribose ABC transporter permease [Clostridium sediminicola]|uniref:ABC transporter permease subunit n=1 Tax=Clostridium sediminicola TaxID=3114879 RepID=UPI0031F1F090